MHVVSEINGVIGLTSYGTGVGPNAMENYFTGYALFGSSHLVTYWHARSFIYMEKINGIFK